MKRTVQAVSFKQPLVFFLFPARNKKYNKIRFEYKYGLKEYTRQLMIFFLLISKTHETHGII